MTILLIKNLLKWSDQTNPWIGQWYLLSEFVEKSEKVSHVFIISIFVSF